MILRDDQRIFVRQVNDALALPPHAVLGVAPTGSGKTVCFCALAKQWGGRVMILVHRKELLEQVSRCLTQWEVPHGLIAPDAPNRRDERVQVASVQTLVRRLADYAPPDYLIIDEAHHALLKSSWGKIFRAWPHAKRLGVTATPERLSGEGLREVFSTMIIGPSVKTLIDDGALSRYRLFAPPVQYADRVVRRMGDFARRELNDVMNTRTITGDAVEHYKKHASGKRAMVFCVYIEHAESVAKQFAEAGISSCSIDGEMGAVERSSILKRFANGEIQVLTSCDLVSEGFDLPAVEVAILLRPTQSLALHLQQVGRALRPYLGKNAAIILDHAGNTARHGLPDDPREWSLDGREERKRKSLLSEAPATKTCPECYAVVLAGVVQCPECEHEFEGMGRHIQEVDGTLEEVDLDAERRLSRRQQGAAHSLEALVQLGVSRKYRYPQAWAKRVFEARNRKVPY